MADRKKELQPQEGGEAQQVVTKAQRERRTVVPAADIYERADSLVVVVDMPGVDENSIDIDVEQNTLTIVGRARASDPDGLRLVYSEYEVGDYQRAFTLSDEVDVSKIEATLNHGVLRIVLPKAEEAKPRKITVKTG